MKILEGKSKIIFDDGSLGGGRIKVETQANLLYVIALVGAKKNIDLEIELVGEEARAKIVGFFCGDDEEEFTVSVSTRHLYPLTYGDTLVKGVLSKRSRCLFRGMIEIGKEASGSEDMLTQRTLLLSSDAYAESIPSLEISSCDVKASHAVAVSNLDSDQIFYLESRGLRSQEAEKLIIDGFLAEVFDEIPQTLRAKLMV